MSKEKSKKVNFSRISVLDPAKTRPDPKPRSVVEHLESYHEHGPGDGDRGVALVHPRTLVETNFVSKQVNN